MLFKRQLLTLNTHHLTNKMYRPEK